MGKLIFRYTEEELIEEIREAKSVELEVPDDMTIQEYKIICVRMAHALGYSEKTITKAFGDLIYGDEDRNNLKDLLDELNITPDNKKIK